MQRFLFICSFFLFIPALYAQDHFTIQYTVKGLNGKQAYLLAIHGQKYEEVGRNDAQNGLILFYVKPNLPTGMYRIAFADSLFTDMIFNKEDVIIENDIHDLSRIKVIKSDENLIYYYYWRVAKLINDTIDEIVAKGDAIYRANGGKLTPKLDSMRQKAMALSVRQNIFADSLIRASKNRFAAKIIKADLTPNFFIYRAQKGYYPYKNQFEFLRDHYFDNVDLSDSLLLNTAIIYSKLTSYFTNFSNPKTAANYNRAIDTIMKRVSVSKAVENYTLNLFLNTFEASNQEEVYVHLVENYVATNSCEVENAQDIQKKSEAMKKLATGNVAPAIVANDFSGKPRSLYDVKATVTLLFFWGSECPHCKEMMPDAVKLYQEYKSKGFEIFAFAIDNNEKNWKEAVKNNGSTWINVSDLKGPESPVIIEYHAWQTPAFFLLDAEKKIISRPYTLGQIQEKLEALLK